MAKVTITSPKPFTGPVGGVSFVRGVAAADPDEHAPEFAYFKRAGYVIGEAVVEDTSDDVVVETPTALPDDAPVKSATRADWLMYAEDHDIAVAEKATRDEIIAAVAAAHAGK